MNYTIQTLAKMTGTTVRTLHFYDEIGLLKPAFVGENGYRYYQDQQLATLQQILFYRKLGLNLKQIQEIFTHPQFDHAATLENQKKLVFKKISELKLQIKKIEQSLKLLEQLKTMTPKDAIKSKESLMNSYIDQKFDSESTEQRKQAENEIKKTIENWRWVEDWMPYLARGREIWAEFDELYEKGIKSEAPEALAVAEKQFNYVEEVKKQTKKEFLQSAELLRDPNYRELSGLNAAVRDEVACYMADAMEYFANNNL